MKQLSRLGIQRMIDTSGSAGSGGSGGSGDIIAGLATQGWVAENYLSIEFFSKLFKAYGPAETSGDPDVEVVPNDTESTISNIQAMFGFWTEQYLSALGQGEGGGGGASLNEPLASINTAGLASHPGSAGQTIVWNGSSWTYGTAGGNVGVTSVNLSAPTGFTVSGAPITSSGTITIGFATGYSLPLTADVTKGVTAYGWGDHSLAGYALASNVYSKTDADARFLKISFFRSLFKAYQSNGTTEVVPNDGDTSLISSIKALFGLWTDQYLSALGLGSGGGGGISLNQPLSGINNAGLSAPSAAGITVVWNGSSWVYSNGTGLSVGSLTVSNSLSAYSASIGGNLTAAGNITSSAGGFVVNGKDNTYVLLAGGGTKALSDFPGTGTVNSITIGSGGTNYTPDANGTVTLPSFSTTDTKNTTGATNNTAIALYLVGAPSQTANPETYTRSNCYISSDGYLYSGGNKVLTSVGNVVTSIVVNGSTYSPQSGVVTLPAYPSKTSQLTNDSGYITGYTDTKNTAGSTNKTGTTLYLIGAGSQGSNPQTYSNSNCYIGTDNCLYSGGNKVLTSVGNVVTSISVNGSVYSPQSGVVTLPAYPSKTSQLTNDSGFISGYTDTKNTAGATAANSSKLFLIGATDQTANPQTYTNSDCYISASSYFCCTRSSGRSFSFGAVNEHYIGADSSKLYIYTSSAIAMIFCTNGNERMRILSDGKVGVGLSAPAVQFQVAGACGATSFTNTSDMRKKDVIENKTLELWQVAQAPIFSFTWKGGEYDRDVHVGTSAQYWQSHLPEVITKDSEGYLSMPYDVVALLAAITTAKKVQDHEQRIQALERENAALKNELNRLKAA